MGPFVHISTSAEGGWARARSWKGAVGLDLLLERRSQPEAGRLFRPRAFALEQAGWLKEQTEGEPKLSDEVLDKFLEKMREEMEEEEEEPAMVLTASI